MCCARGLLIAVLVGLGTASAIAATADVPGGGSVISVTAGESAGAAPTIVDMPEMIIVGIADGAPDVSQLDFATMWHRFLASRGEIEHALEGVAYELHIQTAAEPCMHFCLVGSRVSEIGAVPAEMFVKVLPACTYAVFTHRVVDGYAGIYQRMGTWLELSEYEEAHPYDFQLYDSRFKAMDDPESVHDIYVPVQLE